MAYNPDQPRDENGRWTDVYRGESDRSFPAEKARKGSPEGRWFTKDPWEAEPYGLGGRYLHTKTTQYKKGQLPTTVLVTPGEARRAKPINLSDVINGKVN